MNFENCSSASGAAVPILHALQTNYFQTSFEICQNAGRTTRTRRFAEIKFSTFAKSFTVNGRLWFSPEKNFSSILFFSKKIRDRPSPAPRAEGGVRDDQGCGEKCCWGVEQLSDKAGPHEDLSEA